MNNYLSNKLTILYTILIIMVVYIHSPFKEALQYPFASFIQSWTTWFCSIANCLFFSISGYLLAWNINSLCDVRKKQLKRVRTLLLPYIIWNIIFVLWYIILENLPYTSHYINGGGTIEAFRDRSFLLSLKHLFLSPAGFHLWFLRDLLVMILFTPLLWWIARKQWGIALCMAVVSICFYSWLVYFWLGIIAAAQRWDITNYPRPKWLIALSVVVFLSYVTYSALVKTPDIWIVFAANISGIFMLWSVYDCLTTSSTSRNTGLWKYLCGYSFFIYCFHEPTFNIIKKSATAIFGTGELTLIFFYLLNPWIMITIALLTAKLLETFQPRIYKVLTGGR